MITVYKDKSFLISLSRLHQLQSNYWVSKVKSGSAQPNRNKVGSVSWAQVKDIAEIKMKTLMRLQ